MREKKIQRAYALVGKLAAHYDGMMTYSKPTGKFLSRLIWSLDEKKSKAYLDTAFSGIPKDFTGKLLEVPVGTGSLTLHRYKKIPKAQITCLDYTAKMLEVAQAYATTLDVHNVFFVEGDVGALPFEDETFDALLTINGLHAFPDKLKARREIHRVLKKNGIFTGCCYIKGENPVTDTFVRHIFVRGGFFTPPFDTKETLSEWLHSYFSEVHIETIEAEACFICIK